MAMLSIVQSVEVIRISHIDAISLAKTLSGGDGLLKGVTFLIDPAQNSLVLKGEKADIDSAKEIIRMLDVQPRKIRVRAYIVSGRTGRDWTTDSTVYNNEALTLVDERGGLTLSLLPRVNNKNTIDVLVKFDDGSGQVTFKTSAQNGKPLMWMGSETWTASELRKMQSVLGLAPKEPFAFQSEVKLMGKMRFAYVLDLLPEGD